MHDQVSVLEGLTNDEVLGVLMKSNIINCKAGDHVIKKGGTAHNMFVLLEGHVEVYEGDSMVAVFGPGDIFGAMAFLLECERVTDIWAATDCRILSLSESTIRASIDSDAQGAAHLMLNIAKMLCAASAEVCAVEVSDSTAVMRESLSFTAVSTASKLAFTSSASAVVPFENTFSPVMGEATAASGIASVSAPITIPENSPIRRIANPLRRFRSTREVSHECGDLWG
jgi:CRP-like cAMP-binding protein